MDIKRLLEVNLVEEMEIDKLPKEQQEKILLDMGEVIFQRIIIRIAEKLSDDQKEAVNKLIEASDMEGFGKYVEENVENANEMIQEEVAIYKKELMDFASNLEQK